MKTTCHFHPHQPAYWHCPRCKQSHCQQCITRRSPASPLSEQYFYHCPVCGDFSEFIGVAHTNKPFWQRIPQILSYPLSLPTLLLILITALAGGPAATSTVSSSLAVHLTLLVTLAYAFCALKASAGGNPSTGALRGLFQGRHLLHTIFQYLLYMAAALGATATVVSMGLAAGCAYSLVVVGGLPAVIMVLGSTGSISKALNPLACFRCAQRMGRGYLLMVLIIATLAACALAGRLAAIHALPESWQTALSYPLHIYFTLASYHLMGCVIQQYHDRMGPEVHHQDLMPAPVDAAVSKPAAWSREPSADQGVDDRDALDLNPRHARPHPQPRSATIDTFSALLPRVP